ncbi:MAG TPA: argininosuccinate lyase [Candidatus Nanopelagicaceae bacterium]
MSGLWGGRFQQSADDVMFRLSKSTDLDWRLAPYDIAGSRAHLKALTKGGLIDEKESQSIERALTELLSEVLSGKFLPEADDEDVHSALERGLTAKLGEAGGLIRAGRSRNDQVATDLKLLMMDSFAGLTELLLNLSDALLEKSETYIDLIAPGFTHLQHAQPVSFGHELAKHAVALARDLDRIRDWYKRTNLSPLGSGALSGSSLPIDPVATARDLGFTDIAPNSIDAVSDRDFVAEGLFILALIGIHLSRIGEEWTIWASPEFGWTKLADEFSTGSSIMPQKKNPDIAELARGKSGPLVGNLTSILVTMKGLPFAYNRDLQEDKAVTFSSIDHLILLLPALTGMVSSTEFNREKIAGNAVSGFSLATEIADFLVKRNLPFPLAHEIAGKYVQICEAENIELDQLDETKMKQLHPLLNKDLFEALDAKRAIAARSTPNGTAPSSVSAQVRKIRTENDAVRAWISDVRKRFSGMMGQ